MSDDTNEVRHARFKVTRSKPMQMGDLSGIVADALAAGEKMGMRVPTPAEVVAQPMPVGAAEAADIPAASRTQSRVKSDASKSKPKRPVARRNVRVKIDVELISRIQHYCIDVGLHVRDVVEQALEEFLTRRG